jgi:hypothetical protein
MIQQISQGKVAYNIPPSYPCLVKISGMGSSKLGHKFFYLPVVPFTLFVQKALAINLSWLAARRPPHLVQGYLSRHLTETGAACGVACNNRRLLLWHEPRRPVRVMCSMFWICGIRKSSIRISRERLRKGCSSQLGKTINKLECHLARIGGVPYRNNKLVTIIYFRLEKIPEM